ncbi:MAG TPA: hypothetical protein VN953_03560 [Gemmatimonadales bacterium]|nr:hypothetical protein [Gemmatimonadales bacterium]
MASAVPRLAVPQAPARQDTTRPPVPALPNLPADSTFTVEAPGYARAELLYFRNIVGIIFHDTTSGASIRRLLARYSGRIIGGAPGDKEFIVRIPDPGRSFAALEAMVRQLNSERGVRLARKVYYRWPVYHDGRGASRDITPLPHAHGETARPPVPPTPNLPDDSTLTVPSPSGMNVRYYRNIVVVVFHNSTNGVTVRRILAKYRGVIIGGSEARDDPGYYVQIPDPGTTFAAIDSVASLIEAEPGVKLVSIPTWRGLIRIADWRVPGRGRTLR